MPRLPICNLNLQDVALVPFTDWAPHEETIARACAEFVLQAA